MPPSSASRSGRDDLFDGRQHRPGRLREQDVGDGRPLDDEVALSIPILGMNKRDVGRDGRHQQQLFASKGANHPVFGVKETESSCLAPSASA